MLFTPLFSKSDSVSAIMLKVLVALLPGIAMYVWYFGPAILVSITLASLTALGTEALMLKLRNRPVTPFLKDNSALLTAWLLALSIPPLAPWWLVVVGTAFAIAIAKHLYGGLGNNLFNPAMVGYAVLIISFPVQMTHWIAPHGLGGKSELGFAQQLEYIFIGVLPEQLTLDAVTMATPLDTLKTHLHLDQPVRQISRHADLRPVWRARQRNGGVADSCSAGCICSPRASSAGTFPSPFSAHCSPSPGCSIWSIRRIMSRRCSTGFPVRRCWARSSS